MQVPPALMHLSTIKLKVSLFYTVDKDLEFTTYRGCKFAAIRFVYRQQDKMSRGPAHDDITSN